MPTLRPALVALVLSLLLALGVPPAIAADATPITPGTPFTVALRQAQTEASYSFAASVGQRVTVSTEGDHGFLFSLVSPDGNFSTESVYVDGFATLGEVQPFGGTWSVRVRNTTTRDSDVRVTVGVVTDRTTPLTAGAPTAVTLEPGRRENLTFTGEAGASVGFAVSGVQLEGPAAVQAVLVGPGGQSQDLGRITTATTLSARLSVGGTHTLRLTPELRTTGRLDVTLTRVQDSTVIVTAGRPVQVSYPGTGAGVALRLTGIAGRRLTLGATASDLSSPTGQESSVAATLIAPDGTRTTFTTLTGRGFHEGQELLPSAGTWTLLLAPTGDTAGSQTLVVGLVQDVRATATVGQRLTASITAPGQNADYRVRVRAGQQLVVELGNPQWTAGGAGGDPAEAGAGLDLYDADGNYLAPLIGPGQTYGEYTGATTAGTYVLRLDPRTDTTGTARLLVRYPETVSQQVQLDRATTVAVPRGDRARLVVQAVAGRPLGLQFTRTTWAAPDDYLVATVRRPDGSTFYEGSVSDPSFRQTEALDAAGRWTVLLDPGGPGSGRVTLTLRQPVDQNLTLTPERAVTTRIATPGQVARYRFTGTAGQRITVDAGPGSWTSPIHGTSSAYLTLISPDGQVRQDVDLFPAGGSWGEARDPLDVTGTWVLEVRPYQDATGSQTFTLHRLTDRRGTLTLGTPVVTTIDQRGAQTVYSFAWDGVGQLRVEGVTTSLNAQLTATAPDGGSGHAFLGPDQSSDYLGRGENRAGTWTLRVDGSGPSTGTARITLTAIPLGVPD